MIKLASPSALRRLGILGMNRRNISFIGDYNPRKNFCFTDDKLETKSAALKLGMPVPDLYGTIKHQFEIKHLMRQLKSLESFSEHCIILLISLRFTQILMALKEMRQLFHTNLAQKLIDGYSLVCTQFQRRLIMHLRI